MPLAPSLKARWREALRSGDFKPARVSWAHGPSRLCCLSVLAKVIKPDLVYGSDNACKLFDPDDGTHVDGGWLKPRTGLTEGDMGRFIHMNDADRLTFAEIAARIDEACSDAPEQEAA